MNGRQRQVGWVRTAAITPAGLGHAPIMARDDAVSTMVISSLPASGSVSISPQPDRSIHSCRRLAVVSNPHAQWLHVL